MSFLDCGLLPLARCSCSDSRGEAHKNPILPTQNKNWPSDKWPGHTLAEYKSFSPEEITYKNETKQGGEGGVHFAQLAPILFLKNNKKKVAGAQPEPNTWSFSGSILWNTEHLLQWELRILDRGRGKQNIGLVQWGLFAQAPCRKHMNVGIWQSSLALWKIKTVEVSVCTHCFNLTLLGFYLHFCMGFIANFMLVLPELMPCCCSFLENFHLINISSTVPLII